MTQYIKEYGIIDESIQSSIIEFIKNDKTPLTPSELYIPINEKKIIDIDKRVSQFKTIVNNELFNLFDKLIVEINKIDKFYNYSLVKNDITYIKYEKGGFFKSHSDYLSLTSNVIEEYTLIICMNEKECEGGQTKFTINDKTTYISKESIIPNHTLLFRKDLIHEGLEIINGTKEIITLNLWATPKQFSNIIKITFTQQDNVYNLHDLTEIKKNEHNPKKVYCLSENSIMEIPNIMQSFIQKERENGNKNNILYYELDNFNSYNFEIIYKILTRQYISKVDYKNNIKIIKYFNINYNNLLFNMSSKSNNNDNYCNLNNEISYCINEEQQVFLCDEIKKKGLSNIPFIITFIEGSLVYADDHGGHTDNYTFIMTPIYTSFSECKNILFTGPIFSTFNLLSDNFLNDKPQDIYENYKLCENIFTHHHFSRSKYKYVRFYQKDGNYPTDSASNSETESESEIESESENMSETKNEIVPETKNEIEPETKNEIVHETKNEQKSENNNIIENRSEYVEIEAINKIIYYGLNICSDVSPISGLEDEYYILEKSEIACNKTSITKYDYYDLDENNKIFLNNQQIDKVIKKIDKIKFFNKVKTDINKIDFIISQQTNEDIKHSFCNESVYGNLKVITIYGFLKMD